MSSVDFFVSIGLEKKTAENISKNSDISKFLIELAAEVEKTLDFF
jgi:hypothetical protein